MKTNVIKFIAIVIINLSLNNSFSGEFLPRTLTFKGADKFEKLKKYAKKKRLDKMAIGERVLSVAKFLKGTPYKGLTLEVDKFIESPSVNFNKLDCWTLFETSLGFARMLAQKKKDYTQGDLLKEIEYTRYRGGRCNGNYLDRIHYLAEWFFENEARGVALDFTKEMGGKRMNGRKCQEMTKLWKYYPMLKANTGLLEPMARLEKQISNFPVYYYPKEKVKNIERVLQNGDIIGIVTNYQGGFCSHVGVAQKTKNGTRLLHASSDYKKVVLDDRISNYLYRYKKHAGIIVSRPLPVENSIYDDIVYLNNLSKLVGGYKNMAVVPNKKDFRN